MSETDTDQAIENLLAVLETTRGQLQKIETDAAADESALDTARSEYESARAMYESLARAFGLGQTTRRPVKPDASFADSLAESLELRRSPVRCERARRDQAPRDRTRPAPVPALACGGARPDCEAQSCTARPLGGAPRRMVSCWRA